MSEPSPNSPQETKELFEAIAKFMAENRALLAQGAAIELAGLEKQVQNLCEQVLQLSAAESAEYADLLQELFDDLSVLGVDLVTQKEALEHEIRYLSSHKKANVAYKTIDASGSKNNDSEK